MVKCGPKPRKLTARQLRNLVREEKRALSLQRQAAQAPPSPRKTKVWVRPSQFDVSLARKKRVKNFPRQMAPRKARSEASVAFSAITEEVPLFEELKRTNRLVYIHVPQQPVPLVWPQMSTRELIHDSSITSVTGPATPIAKWGYPETVSGLALNMSPVPSNGQLSLSSTPIASSTPLITPNIKVRPLSPVYVEDKPRNTPAPDEGVFQDKAAIVTSSPKPALSTGTAHNGNPGFQRLSGSEGGSLDAHAFAASPSTTSRKSNISAEQHLDFDPTSREDFPRPEDPSSLSVDNLGQCNKKVVLPTIRPLVIQRCVQSLQASHILSQLPIEQYPDTTTLPRVQIPKTVLRSPLSVNQSMQADSPETIYHRSLETSFWAESSRSPNVKDQSHFEGSFLTLYQDGDAHPGTVSKSEQSISKPISPTVVSVHPRQNKEPVLAPDNATPVIGRSPCRFENQRYSRSNLVQPDSTHVVQPIKPASSAHIGGTFSSFRPKGRLFGTYGGRNNGLGVDRSVGAFANAILRQTGHLRQKADDMPAADVAVVKNEIRHDGTAIHVKNSGIQDHYMFSKTQGQSTPFNNSQFYLSGNSTLQSRAANIPYRSSMDGPKIPLAPAAVIKDDPFKRPAIRPSRKRFLPAGRVIAYRVESNLYGQPEPHETSLAREPLRNHAGLIVDKPATCSQILGVPRPPVGTSSASRQNGQDMCHHVSADIGAFNMQVQGRTDGLATESSGYYIRTLPPQGVQSQPQTSLMGVPPSESERTIKKRATIEFSKKGTVFMALKAVYNKLWA